MIPPSTIAAAVCAVLACCGAGLHVVASLRLRKHLRAAETPAAETPPLTLWRALKPGVPRLAENLEALVEASRDRDQVLIGVDAGSPDVAVCEALRAKFPAREISIVPCEPNRAANPKISKFVQMTPHARHAHWLLTDSEAELDRAFVEGFRGEWAAQKCAALTAGYRFRGARTLPQIFDIAPALLTLWPGLMACRRINFTLGAATGVHAEDVRALGGWQSFADELAEDRALGARLDASGKRVHLSRHVLTLDCDALGWWDWLKHQHRVAVTYRKASPLGALGLPILHAVPLGLLASFVGGTDFWCGFAVFIYLVRVGAAQSLDRALRFQLPARPVAVLLVPFVETVCWLFAWLPLPVWWAGRWRRLS
jgi:ceramide glucosyltransferase